MAQFVHQYVERLLEAQYVVGQRLGVNVYGIDKQAYVMNLMNLTMLGMVMKKVSDVAPAVTDAVWVDALQHALDSTPQTPWPQWMLDQVNPHEPPPVV